MGNRTGQALIPLVNQDGQWHFDPAQARQEILARRIGANELTAIEICHGYVEAQFEYAQAHHTKGVPVLRPEDRQLIWQTGQVYIG